MAMPEYQNHRIHKIHGRSLHHPRLVTSHIAISDGARRCGVSPRHYGGAGSSTSSYGRGRGWKPRLQAIANVSMMAKVASVARRLFRTVASMYSPFSVNAFGRARLLGDIFADEKFGSSEYLVEEYE